MKQTLNTLIFIVLATPIFGQANEKPKVAFCEMGEGCVFYTHPFTYKQLDNIFNYLGDYETRKGILTFMKNKQGEEINYPDRKRNPKELHEYFGGKGEPPVKPWTVGIYPHIQPEDGNWTVQNQKPQVSNCPKGVESQLDKVQMIQSGNKVFNKPFSPVELLPAKEVLWFPIKPNVFKGILQLPDAPNFTTVYDVKILSPKSMEGLMNYSIKIPGLPTCKINVNFKYTKN